MMKERRSIFYNREEVGNIYDTYIEVTTICELGNP
jgi:hypothetical protein